MSYLPFEIKVAAQVVAYHRTSPNDKLVTCHDHDQAVRMCLEEEAEYATDIQLMNNDKDNFCMLYWRSLFAKSPPDVSDSHDHAYVETFDMAAFPKQFCLRASSIDPWLENFTAASEDADTSVSTPTPNDGTLVDPPHYIMLEEDASVEGTEMATPVSTPARSLFTSPAPPARAMHRTPNIPLGSNPLSTDQEETITITRSELEAREAHAEQLGEAIAKLKSIIGSLKDVTKTQQQPRRFCDAEVIGFFDPTGVGLPARADLAENTVYSEGKYTYFTDVYVFTDQLKRLASQYSEEVIVEYWPSCLKHRGLVWFHSELGDDERATISKQNLAYSIDILTERWRRRDHHYALANMEFTLDDVVERRDIVRFCTAVIGLLRHGPGNSESPCLKAWKCLDQGVQRACAVASPNIYTRPSDFYKALRECTASLAIEGVLHETTMRVNQDYAQRWYKKKASANHRLWD